MLEYKGPGSIQESEIKAEMAHYPKERYAAVLTFFKKLGVDALVEDPNAKNEFVQNLSFEDFKKLLTRINGILREIPNTKERTTDGKHVIVFSADAQQILYTPPYHEDKDELLQQTFSALKRMGTNKDSAAMVWSSLNAIHLFGDGNGRTSRLAYVFLASSAGDPDIRMTNSREFQRMVEQYIAEKVHHLPLDKGSEIKSENDFEAPTSKDHKNNAAERLLFANGFTYDQHIMVTAMEMYCRDKGLDFEKDLLTKDHSFSFTLFFERMSEDQIKEIVTMYRELKKEFITTTIDIFENPSEHTLHKNLPDNFKRREEFIQRYPDKTMKDAFFSSEEGLFGDIAKEDDFSWEEFVKIMESKAGIF